MRNAEYEEGIAEENFFHYSDPIVITQVSGDFQNSTPTFTKFDLS